MRIWCYFFGVIVWVRVVLRKTVVGDCRFDYLRGSHLQSQEYRFPLVGSPSNNHKLPTTALFVPMLHQFRIAFLWEGIQSWPHASQLYETVYTKQFGWVLSWLIGSASASHQCGPGSIPGWGSDAVAASDMGLSSTVWATLCSWVGRIKPLTYSSNQSTNPIWGSLKNPQHLKKRVGESISPVLAACNNSFQ